MRVLLALCLATLVTAGRSGAQADTDQETIYQRAQTALRIRNLIRTLAGDERVLIVLNRGDGQVVARFVAAPLALTGGRLTVPTAAQLDRIEFVLDSLRRTRRGAQDTEPERPVSRGGPEDIMGLPSQADLLIGLADYLVERARDEIVASFVRDFRNYLQGDQVLRTLISRTALVIHDVDSMSVRAIVPTLRAAVREDLESLPDSLISPMVLGEGESPERRLHVQTFATAVRVLNGVRAGRTPVASLGDLSSLDPAKMSDRRLRYPLRIVGHVAREFAISEGEVRDLLQNSDGRKYFVAILLDEAIQKDLERPSDLEARLDSLISKHQVDIIAFVTQLKTLQDEIERLRGMISDETTPQQWASVGITAMRMTGQVLRSIQTLMPASDTAASAGTTLSDSAHEVATPGLTRVGRTIEMTADLMSAVISKDYRRVVVLGVAALEELGRGRLTARQFRYLTLVSGIATAENAEEVTAALYASTEPVGSFRAKRGVDDGTTRRQAITLNAYLGASFGMETTRSSAVPNETAGQFGLAVPVGLEYSVGFRAVPSVSLFIPLIDVGTLASFRFESDSVEENPEIGFEQVFSPGAFLVFGITGTRPLSAGIGVQYSPHLRKLRVTEEKVNVVRFSAFLGIDMPLLRF